jgi:hypothetical protein
MRALVYYCRWQGAALRLRGRDATAVWGHLVFTDDAGVERGEAFRFELANGRLTLSKPEGDETLQLDEMGVVVD